MSIESAAKSRGRGRLRVLALIPGYNVGPQIEERVLQRVPRDLVDEMLVIDDGSTDDTAARARAGGATVISHERNRGVGAALRTGFQYAQARGYDAVVILNAIGKFDPAGLGVLLAALQDGSADLVQGSRFVPGGSFTRMPMKRQLGTRAYSALFSLLLGRRVSDASSGIRAFRCAILDTPGMDVSQAWLDRYELEPYLLWKALQLGLRVVEVPMDVLYPEGPRQAYTRMRPIRDWWRLSRPLLILGAERLRRAPRTTRPAR
jgi:dolichol-phosphate mannosyltransferase